MLKKRYKCPHFRILIIGRANAGKTTILEKVCGVEQGTEPVIFDKDGVELDGKPSMIFHIKNLLTRKIRCNCNTFDANN